MECTWSGHISSSSKIQSFHGSVKLLKCIAIKKELFIIISIVFLHDRSRKMSLLILSVIWTKTAFVSIY